MIPDFSELLRLSAGAESRHWLEQNFPSKDLPLIDALHDHASQIERDNPQLALKVAQILRTASEVWMDQETRAKALLVEANTHRLTEELATSLQKYQTAAEIYHELGLADERINTFIGQIDVLVSLANYEEALELAKSCIRHFRQNQDDGRLGRTLMNRGNIFARQGELLLASDDYAESISIFSELGLTSYLGMAEANQGNVLEDANEFREAEQHYMRARAHFLSSDMNLAVAQVDHNLAYLAFSTGRFQHSLQLFAQARECFVHHQSDVYVAFVDLYRSEVYLVLNLWDKAVEHLKQARAYFQKATMPWEEARALLQEAVGLTQLGDPDAAEACFQAARVLFEKIGVPIWTSLIDYYYSFIQIERGAFEEAAELCEAAHQSFTARGMVGLAAQCQLNLGTIALHKNDLSGAEVAFEQAMQVLGDTELTSILYRYHYGLAQIHQRRKEYSAAQDAYIEAFVNIERLEQTVGTEDYRIAFRKNKQRVYDEYILLCLQIGGAEQHRQAFSALERSKANVLLSAVERGLQNFIQAPESSELVQRIAELREELAWHYNRLLVPKDPDNPTNTRDDNRALLSEVGKQEKELEKIIGQAQELYAGQLLEPQHVSRIAPADIQALLPPGTVVVEYFTTVQQIVVFILSREEFTTLLFDVELDSVHDRLREIQAQMNRFKLGSSFVSKYSSMMLASIQNTLGELYQFLMEPILEHLQKSDRHSVDTLIFVPHGILHSVPFHALYMGNQYLIERFGVSYVPSSAILFNLFQQRNVETCEPGMIIGVSDDSIPNAEAEAKEIASLFPEASSYTDGQATAAVLSSSESRTAFLHLASHALFRTDNPKYSAIKLDDQWLTLYDLEALQLKADLITLSACETGMSQVQVGDELIGFYGVFFKKGIQALTLSLWQVDDATTVELMKHFYGKLSDGATCRTALRDAQLYILSTTHKHPYYWAPFILTGNPFHKLT